MISDMRSILYTKRTILFASLSCVIATVALPLHAADRLISGQYEFTATTDGKTQTLSRCFTPEEAKSVNGDAKAGREYAEKAGKGTCSITAYDVKGDTVSLSMACGDSVTTSRATYHGNTYDADTTTTFTIDGKRIVRATHVKAKRVGACK
jgi:hypothetical protein